MLILLATRIYSTDSLHDKNPGPIHEHPKIRSNHPRKYGYHTFKMVSRSSSLRGVES